MQPKTPTKDQLREINRKAIRKHEKATYETRQAQKIKNKAYRKTIEKGLGDFKRGVKKGMRGR